MSLLERASADGGQWTALTLANSWVNYGSGYQEAEYRISGDMVYLRGTIKSGTFGVAVTTLPVGARPPSHVGAVPSIGGGYACHFDVLTSGLVIAYNVSGSATNAYLSLNTVSFSLTP